MKYYTAQIAVDNVAGVKIFEALRNFGELKMYMIWGSTCRV
jgi:hypothetical protein